MYKRQGIVAAGLTLVMLTGNIDLSVGNMITMMCCFCAQFMMETDNAILSVLGTVALAGVFGLLNGVLVSYVKLNSFITTLGTSSIFYAIAVLVSAGTVRVIPNDCDPLFRRLGDTAFFGGSLSILIVWFVVVVVILGLILSRTVFGQQLYAIGANPVAARFSGIKYKRNVTLAYVITGLCVGLAAVVTMANALSANPQSCLLYTSPSPRD